MFVFMVNQPCSVVKYLNFDILTQGRVRLWEYLFLMIKFYGAHYMSGTIHRTSPMKLLLPPILMTCKRSRLCQAILVILTVVWFWCISQTWATSDICLTIINHWNVVAIEMFAVDSVDENLVIAWQWGNYWIRIFLFSEILSSLTQ